MLELKGLYVFYRVKLAKFLGLYKHYSPHFDERESIFLHVPKCGGISLVESLYGVSRSQHSTWREFFSEDRVKFGRYFKFSFVREPVARCYSAYNYLRGGGRGPMDLYWRDRYVSKYDSFDEFVLLGLEIAINDAAEHFIPQHKFICDDTGKVVVDFVGRIEQMDEDFQVLAARLGVVNSLEVRNASDTTIEYELSSLARSKILHLYRKDYEIFGY